MTDVILFSTTDSHQSDSVVTGRRSVDVTCPVCGVARPVLVLARRDLARAKLRPCWTCHMASPHVADEDAPTVAVTCPRCLRDRLITVRFEYQRLYAESRMCKSCSTEEMRAAPRPPVAGPTVAAAKTYVPDETEVDWVVVDRLMTGLVRDGWREARRTERIAAVAELTARGLSADRIADRMHVSQRTVVRLRQAIRDDAAAEAQRAQAEADRIALWAATWAGTPPTTMTEAEAA